MTKGHLIRLRSIRLPSDYNQGKLISIFQTCFVLVFTSSSTLEKPRRYLAHLINLVRIGLVKLSRIRLMDRRLIQSPEIFYSVSGDLLRSSNDQLP